MPRKPSNAEETKTPATDPEVPQDPPAGDPGQDAAAALTEPSEKPQSAKKVRVITKGYLGPKLLKNGDITDDPEYVAILKQKGQKKVEAVK